MASIDLIVYDFDGTLFDTRMDIARSVNLTLKKLNLPEHNLETIFSFIGGGMAVLMEKAMGGSKLQDLDRAVQMFRNIYAENLVIDTVPYPDIRETIFGLQSKKQAINSNKPERFIRSILDRFEFSSPFFSIIGGDTFETRKPDPEGLLCLINQADVSAKNTLMVGDSGIDIETARRAGILSCGVAWGIGGKASVSKADYVIEVIAELEEIITNEM